MPRYFFNISQSPRDAEGVDFPDDAAARGAALDTFGQIIRELETGARCDDGCRMDVADAAGEPVLTLTFSAKGR